MQTELKPFEVQVKAGMEFLDNHAPGWLEKININKLDQESTVNCVLGQLYGRYPIGLFLLGLDMTKSIEYGFSVGLHVSDYEKEYSKLTRAWLFYIMEKRFKGVKKTYKFTWFENMKFELWKMQNNMQRLLQG